MLVKDHHGDSAVLVGKWELHNEHKRKGASTCEDNRLISETFVKSSSTNKRNSFFHLENNSIIELYFVLAKTNPGILHVKYLNLRRKTAHEFSCPSKDQSTKSGISFTYHLDGIALDMASGVMNVDEVELFCCVFTMKLRLEIALLAISFLNISGQSVYCRLNWCRSRSVHVVCSV